MKILISYDSWSESFHPVDEHGIPLEPEQLQALGLKDFQTFEIELLDKKIV